ncbi:DUF1294 domain-containing protein [archaeon]|nr:MAG: DUF1294 domain-containing protein [archaeon]
MVSLIVSLLFLCFSAVSLFYMPFHIALLLINVFTFISFGYDKAQAKALAGTSRGGAYFRTSESMLLCMCIVGGWIGKLETFNIRLCISDTYIRAHRRGFV